MKKEEKNKSEVETQKSEGEAQSTKLKAHGNEGQAQSSKPTTKNPEQIAHDNDESTSHISQLKAHKSEIEKELRAKIEDEKMKRVQLMADFENYKKRMDAEKATFGAITNMGLILDILEISDDINLGLSDENLDLNRSKELLNIAKDKLIAASLKAGIEKIEIKVGDDFDRNKMEAVTTIPSEDQKNKVIAVISSAYKYRGQDTILKAAKVVVGK